MDALRLGLVADVGVVAVVGVVAAGTGLVGTDVADVG